MRLMWLVFWCVVTFLLLATTTIAIIVFNAPVPSNSTAFIECVKATILCLGGCGVILSTYFTAVNAFTQRKSDIIKNTYDLLMRWDDPHLFNARKWTRRTKDKEADTSKNQMLIDIESNEELKNSVILVLNYFEHIRFSIKTMRADKNLFKRSLGPTVTDIATRFLPYAAKLGTEFESDLKDLIQELK